VITATGVSCRRLGIPSLDALTGAGVFSGAAASQAQAIKDRDVSGAGGADSAGQAAARLARHAAQVTAPVRGPPLAEDMPGYLLRQVTSTPDIAVRHSVVVTGGTGTGWPESPALRDRPSEMTRTVPATALLVLIGAGPRTRWLPGGIVRGRRGSVVTGPAGRRAGPARGAGRRGVLPCSWSPACPGSSRPATSAADRSSG
jgi:thioredoxin reductase (NADPH)